MSIMKLPSGRWRAQCWSSVDGRNVAVSQVLGPNFRSFATKREAKQAREQARAILAERSGNRITVRAWRDRWLTDPLYARPKTSTMVHYRERTKGFADKYGTMPLARVDGLVVAEWIAGGKNLHTVKELSAMWTDAASAKAGNLVNTNPWRGLGVTPKNRDVMPPPDEAGMARLVAVAHELTIPAFAAYLEFACLMGARPGELDALTWDRVRFADHEVDIHEQWSVKAKALTPPKYGPYTLGLHARARDVLLRVRAEGSTAGDRWVFPTTTGHHFTPSTRSHHWNRVRCTAGMGNLTLYKATRHYFGWFALNVLELPPHVVAEQLGHKDGGKLVIRTYGHPDAKVARRRIREAYDAHTKARPVQAVKDRKVS